MANQPGASYNSWPWPARLPLKEKWFPSLPTNGSLRANNRAVMMAGDWCVVGALAWVAWRVYTNHKSGAFQTRNQHLTGFPPALIAQDIEGFDEESIAKHRKVKRENLDQYVAEFASSRTHGTNVEDFIFKY